MHILIVKVFDIKYLLSDSSYEPPSCVDMILSKTFVQTVPHCRLDHRGGRRSPAVACWASDHWVASSNPLRGKFRH